MGYNAFKPAARRGFAAMICAGALACGLAAPSAVASDAMVKSPAKSIIVLPFDMVDASAAAQANDGPLAGDIARLKRTQRVVRQAVSKQPVFRLLSNKAVKSEIEDAQSAYQYLYECDGCQIAIGKKASADLVMTGWLQKVSNLILSINAAIFNVKTGKEVAVASVGMRHDTDKSWRHAALYLVNERLMKNYQILQARTKSVSNTGADAMTN